MAEQRVHRRLAAILATDVAGYSRLMSTDEAGTLAALQSHRAEIQNAKVEEFRGRLVKTTGDGALVEFPSVVAAVECAVAIQRAMAERNSAVPVEKRIEFRIGVNLGDVIVEGEDIYGNGVNLAARLEALADPGGICLSQAAYEQCRGNIDATFSDLGEQRLKNLAQPTRVWAWSTERAAGSPLDKLAAPRPVLARPAIAVLPFQNMSGDPGQEYFADGVTEEIITALSQFRWLFVIARNSTFAYKDRAVDVKQVGRELGVGYALEGSVRKAANRLRITAQLIDTMTGAHLWANRFDGELEDIFDLQDQVTANVVGAIGPKLELAEIERAKRKPTDSLDAYDYYLRGMGSVYQWTKQGISEALRLFHKAIQIDPEFASAFAMAAYCYLQRKSHGWFTNRPEEIAEAARLARRAAELGNDDAVALSKAAHAIAYVVGDVESGASFVDRALVLNPNLAAAWYVSGWVRVFLGEPEVALEHLARATRLSPFDPLIFHVHAAIAYAHFFAGRYDNASASVEKALHAQPNYLTALRGAAAIHALAGRLDQARKLMSHIRELDPTLRISNLPDLIPFRRAKDFDQWAGGLRKAGLPE